ncbi:hypothetical protein [Kiloniella sp. b19]|uniref:hypothetical protein n=1 Tax=Kiloniella sp. GXU_MW_B19 TaxID=3141326 RepID=UPI0031E3C1FE
MTNSRLLSDHSLWPLCTTLAEGPQSLSQHLEMLAIWNRWFARNQPFVTLRLYADPLSLEQAEGTARATKKWLRDGADQNIRSLVKAMVIVIPPESLEAMKHMNVEAVFGIPGGIFSDLQDALDWIGEHRHLCDLPSVETVLQRLEQTAEPLPRETRSTKR